jgi:hypothetical protein
MHIALAFVPNGRAQVISRFLSAFSPLRPCSSRSLIMRGLGQTSPRGRQCMGSHISHATVTPAPNDE